MSIQQTEGGNLWEKSMSMHWQALIRAVVSVPRRDRLASILVLLLTGTGLLGTPAFGQVKPFPPRPKPSELVPCPPGHYPFRESGGECRKLSEPVPVSCPDRYESDPQNNCVLKPPKPEQLVSCPEDPDIAIAKEIAERLVIQFGIKGAYEYVYQRSDGKRGGKITFVEANLLLSAIKVIEMEYWRGRPLLTEDGVDTALGILRRKAQAEAAACLEIGKLRTESGFAASGFSQIAEWFGGDKATQIFWGNVGGLLGQAGEVWSNRGENHP